MPRGRRRGGLGGQFVGTSGTTGGTGGVSAPERVSTRVVRHSDGSRTITTTNPNTGQVIKVVNKDSSGKVTSTTAPSPGVTSTGGVIEEVKPEPSRRVGEKFETSVPGRFGFAGGRVTAIFEGSKRTGARKVFEPSVSEIDRPGKEPIKVTRLREPSIGVVVSEREAEIKRRGGRGLTEQQLQEAELIARREAPKVIALPPGEAERIQSFFKEFGLSKAEDVFKGVEKGTLDIKKTPEGLKVTARTPRVIIPPEPGVKPTKIEEDLSFTQKSVKLFLEGLEETKEGFKTRFKPTGIEGMVGVTTTPDTKLLSGTGKIIGGIGGTLLGSLFELPSKALRTPPVVSDIGTGTLRESFEKRKIFEAEAEAGKLQIGFLATGITDLTPFRFPVREPTKIEIRPGVKPEFPRPRIGDRAGIERGFQPRGEELGLVKSGELQARLKEPARLSRADFFEEIQLEPRAEVRARLAEQLRVLIEPEPRPPPPIKTLEDFPTLRKSFLEGRQTTFDIDQLITRQPPRLPPEEGIQVKFKPRILEGRKGQQRLVPELERVFDRPSSFFGLEPGEVFRPTPRVQVPGLEVVKPTTSIGFVPLTLDISKRAVVARTGIESRIENLLELSADIRLGQAQRVGQELNVLQRTSTLQRTGQQQIQEQMLGQTLEQELVSKQVVTPQVTTKLDLRIGKPGIPRPTPPPFPPTPPIPPPLMVEEKVRRQGFDVMVRESRPKGKTKRKFFKVNAEPLPENKALNLGSDIVDNSSARTFKIIKSKRTTEKRDDIMFNKSHKFRRPRGRTALPSGSYVEETTHLIDTPGERRGITAKGLIALRSKRKKAKNLVGNKEAFGTIKGLIGRGQSLRSIREMLK